MAFLLDDFFCLRSKIGPFDLIMADPPWSYSLWSKAGEAKSAQAQYRCMDLDAIKALPVAELAAPDCLLWLWATNPMLPQAIETMAAWGFQFKTSGHWSKRNEETNKLAFGTGYILRCAGEPFLIGTIGTPRTTRSTRSVIEAKATGHSRKPDEAFRAAEGLMPGARRIELFSRKSRDGWTCWGDEAGIFDEAVA